MEGKQQTTVGSLRYLPVPAECVECPGRYQRWQAAQSSNVHSSDSEGRHAASAACPVQQERLGQAHDDSAESHARSHEATNPAARTANPLTGSFPPSLATLVAFDLINLHAQPIIEQSHTIRCLLWDGRNCWACHLTG